jgi:hypothetical protein
MEPSWSDDVEICLDKIRKNSQTLTDYHRKRYFKLNGFIKYFRIPVIVISAMNSVISVMLSRFISQSNVSVLTSVLSLIVGVIGSLELFLGIQEKLNSEHASSKNHYLLSIEIFKILSLDRDNRQQEPLVFLNEKFEEYSKLFTASNIKNDKVKDFLFILEPDGPSGVPRAPEPSTPHENSDPTHLTTVIVADIRKPDEPQMSVSSLPAKNVTRTSHIIQDQPQLSEGIDES